MALLPRKSYIIHAMEVIFLASFTIGLFGKSQAQGYEALNCRKHSAVITEFGGVGDGKTLNTKAFQSAINHLRKYSSDGGAQLIVPAGKWLTGSFNLTSYFTLYISKGAVLLASQDESDYPLIPPLPSYGKGRDADGPRYASLIFGTNLNDVVITGGNGTINGQGATWWLNFRGEKLKYTRPYIIEIMYSKQIQISNLTIIDAPSWNVHPIYSSDILIQGLTIIAPVDSPNTDGINPDSCSNTRIQDSYIVSGDDCIAVKSGWDQYGIKFNMPTEHLIIRRVTCISPDSAGIALGSEMSGGISDVRAEDFYAINTESAVRIKTGAGRGAFVKNIFVRRMRLYTMKYVFWMAGNYGSHPDTGFDPKALPQIQDINYSDVIAKNVTIAGDLEGMIGNPFTGICMSDVTIEISEKSKKKPWNCSDISGVSNRVSPSPCNLLPEKKGKSCAFPVDVLPIDKVQLKTCSI